MVDTTESTIPAETHEVPTESGGLNERRNCIRIGQVDEPCEGVLSDGMTSRRVTFVNQSAEGFGVRCQLPVSWSVDQRLRLHAGGSWHEVKVIYVEQKGDQQQIGLRRLGECGDYRGPSPLLVMWGGMRSVFKQGRSLPILGLGFAFLLCLVVLLIVLNPDSPWNGARWLRGRPVDESGHGSQTEPIASPAANTRTANGADRKPEEHDKPSMNERITALFSNAADIAWVDLERALDLTIEQSRQLLALLMGGTDGQSLENVDMSKIMIDNRREFAAYLRSLPDQSYAFLSDEQQQALRGMLDRMSL